jgi:hypothetical protein
MATNYLPDGDHVVRHIPAAQLIRDPNTDIVTGCFPQAFELRPDEEYLSASWLEFFSGVFLECLAGVGAAMGKTRKIGPRHGFAVGKVRDVKEACAEFEMRIRIIHEPSDHNPCYTAVRRYKSDDLELLELLASDAWSSTIEAQQVCQMYGPWPRR